MSDAAMRCGMCGSIGNADCMYECSYCGDPLCDRDAELHDSEGNLVCHPCFWLAELAGCGGDAAWAG